MELFRSIRLRIRIFFTDQQLFIDRESDIAVCKGSRTALETLYTALGECPHWLKSGAQFSEALQQRSRPN
jgi:hypothetical protein